MDHFFVSSGRFTKGPFTAEDLRRLVQSGELQLEDSVWSADEDRWVEVASLEPVRELLGEVHAQERTAPKRILALASGKGGVGKTVLSASIATALAAAGRKVLLVDGDVGGPDLHIQFGLEPARGEGSGTVPRATWAPVPTEIPNLELLATEPGVLGAAQATASQRLRLLRAIHSSDAEEVVLDLGAGTNYLILDLFVSADLPILVATPDPLSLHEAFNLVKLGLLWKLLGRNPRSAARWDGLLGKGPDGRGITLRTPIPEIVARLEQQKPEVAERWKAVLAGWHPQLILNMVRDNKERKEAGALQIACKELLGVDLGYLGHVDWDPTVREAINHYRPFILHNPGGPAARSLARLVAVRFLGKGQFQGFFEARKIRRTTGELGNEIARTEPVAEVICSYRCSYWGDCEFQQGGQPCPVRQFEAVFRTGMTSS
ncbi:MAG: P-loop NTPase [candidate division KSB1 bacterium]|nr:P-loop NTPase [candidate division KSB1 bacterium]